MARVSLLAILSCFASAASEVTDLGLSVPLTEEGYQQVAALKSDQSMEFFAVRILNSKGMESTNESELQGLVPWFSGSKAVQSFAKLGTEAMSKPWVKKAVDSNEDLSKSSAQSATVGLYRVTYSGGVPVTSGPSRREKFIDLLREGQEVDVVEIGAVVENRLRARVAEPAGWISLKQVALKLDFAVPVALKAETHFSSEWWWQTVAANAGQPAKKMTEQPVKHAKTMTEVVTKKCQSYCGKHKLHWQAKCQWTSNDCSACTECPAPASAGSQILMTESLNETAEMATLSASEVAEMTKGCNWACYLDHYPSLRNENWEAKNGNIDYARDHFIQYGHAAGKSCTCDAKN